MEKVFSKMLNKVLGSFIDNFDSEQVDISLLKGKIELKNLALKKDFLYLLGLPFEMNYGIVKNIKVKISWRKLNTKAVRITLSEVYAYLTPKDPTEWDEERERGNLVKAKKMKLNRFEAMQVQEDEDEEEEMGYFKKKILTIYNNLELQIEDIYLRYEHHLANQPSFTVGCYLRYIEAHTCSSSWEKQFSTESDVIFKYIRIDDFSVFIDYECKHRLSDFSESPIDIAFDSVAAMEKNREIDHNFLLTPSFFEAKVVSNKKGKQKKLPLMQIDLDISKTSLEFYVKHAGLLMTVMKLFKLHSNFTAGVRQEMKEKPFQPGIITKYQEVYTKWTAAVMKDKKKEAEKALADLNSLEEGVIIEDILLQREAALLAYRINVASNKIEKLEAKKKGKSIAKIFSDSEKINSEIQEKINSLKSLIAVLKSGKKPVELNSEELAKLELTINFQSPNCKIYENKNSELLDISVKKLYISVRVGGVSPSIKFTVNRCLITDLYEKSAIFPNLLELQSFTLEASTNPLTLSVTCTKAFIYVIFSTIFKTITSLKSSLKSIQSEAGESTFQEKYEVYVSKGKQFLSENANRVNKTKADKAFFDLNIDMEAPIIFVPSDYTDKRSILCVDFGSINAQSFSCLDDSGVLVDHFPFILTEFSLYTIWNWDSLRSRTSIAKNNILNPIEFRFRIVKPKPNTQNVNETKIEVTGSAIEFTINAMSIQSIEEIFKVMNKYVPEKEKVSRRLSKELAVKQRIVSSFVITKSDPMSIDFSIEKFVMSFHEMKPVATLLFDEIKLAGKIDCYRVTKMKFTVFEIYLKDERIEAAVPDIIINPAMSLVSHFMKAMSKSQLTVDIFRDPNRNVMDVGVNMKDLKFFLSLDFINAMIKTFLADKEVLQFLSKMKPGSTEVVADYSKQKKGFTRFSAIFQQLELMIPTKKDETEIEAYISTALTVTFESHNTLLVLFSSANKVLRQTAISQDKEFTLVLSHLTTSIKSSSSHYNVIQPCRFMIECKILSDVFKKSVKTVATIRMESIVLFFGSKFLEFLKSFSADLKEFKANFKGSKVKKEAIVEEIEKKIQADIDCDAFQVFILNDKNVEIESLIAHKCSYITFLMIKEKDVLALSGDIIMNTEYYNSLLACWEPVVEDSKVSISISSSSEKFEFEVDLPQVLNINLTKGLFTNIASLNSIMNQSQPISEVKVKKSKVKILKSFEYIVQNRLDIPFSVWLSLENDPLNTFLGPNHQKSFSHEYVQKLSTLMNQKAKSTSLMNSVQLPTAITYIFETETFNLNADHLGFTHMKIGYQGTEYDIIVYIYSDVGKRFVVFDSAYKIANNTQYDVEVLSKEQKFVCKAHSLVSIPLTWTKSLAEVRLKLENKELRIKEGEIEIDSRTTLVHQISSYKVGNEFLRISDISYKYYIHNLLHTQIDVFTEENRSVNTGSAIDVAGDTELHLKESEKFYLKVHESDSVSQTDLVVLTEFNNDILKVTESGMSVRLTTTEKLFTKYNCFTDSFGKTILNISALEKDPKSKFYPQRITLFADYIIINKSQFDLEMDELALKKSSLSYFSSDSTKVKLRLLEGSSNWSDSFRIDTIGVSGAVEVIKKQEFPQPLSFGLHIASAPDPLKNTTLIHLSPRFVLWNQLDFDIYVSQSGHNYAPVLLAGSSSEQGSFVTFDYTFVEKIKTIEVSMDKANWSGPFSIENLNDIQVKLKSDPMVSEKKLSFFQRNWFVPKEDLQFRFIRVLITTMDESCIHVVFMNPKDPDFRIVNRTNQELYYTQNDVQSSKLMIKSGESVPWAWEDHTTPKKKLKVFYEDAVGVFSIEKVLYQKNPENSKQDTAEIKETPKKRLKDCFVYVEIRDATRELIIKHPTFKEEGEDGKKTTRYNSFTKGLIGARGNTNIKQAFEKTFSFKLKTNELGVSLFDSDSRENFYIFFQDLHLKLAVKNLILPFRKEKNFRMKLKLKHFQIDSSDPDPNLFTVILAPMFLIQDSSSGPQVEKNYFLLLELEVTDTEKKNTEGVFIPNMKIIENFDLVLQKVQAKIDEAAVIKLMHLASLFKLLKPAKPSAVRDSAALSTAIPVLPFNKSSSLQKFYFRFIKLGVLQLTLTFQRSDKPSKSHESKRLVKVLKAVGGAFTNISNVPLNFKEIFIVNSFQTRQNFGMILVKNYVRQGITQVYKLFGSLDIIGNPLSLIDTLGTGVYEFMTEPAKGLIGGPKAFAIGLGKGVKSLVSSIIKGSFESAAKITGGLYNVLKSATGETTSNQSVDPENIGKNMLSGLKEGAADIYHGISGVFVKPYKGAKEKGAKGLFQGILSGTAGLITSPIKLVLKLSSVLTTSIASTATLLSQGKIQKYGRARFPRHWGSKLAIEPYNEVFAQAQAFLMSFEALRNERVLYFTEINLQASDVVVKEIQIFLIITLNWVLVVVDGLLKKKVQIFDLESLEIHGFKGIFVLGVVAKNKRFVVPSKDFANLACIYNRLAEFGLRHPDEQSSGFKYPKMLHGPKKSGKEVPGGSLELHRIHCERNYTRCSDCLEPISKSSLDSHKSEFHTPRPCLHCQIPLLPSEHPIHDCPSLPKQCQFCEGKFPHDQFSDHLYQCSSRTEQCPKCQRYIQIRDFSHHLEEVDCLNTRDPYAERLEKITEEVMAEFAEQPGFDFETEIMRRLAEDQDRVFAEELYNKMMQERSPGREPQVEEVKATPVRESDDTELEEAIKQSLDVGSVPVIERGVSENSWTGITDEDQLMNEAILKSFQEK